MNCVRYAPNGDFFVSGGAEGKVRFVCFLPPIIVIISNVYMKLTVAVL